jgi:NitT/TauT family transport system substrate-binding protein
MDNVPGERQMTSYISQVTKLLFLFGGLMLWAFDAASAADNVTLRLDWTLQGFHLPFLWGVDKGIYAAENLNVRILEGRGAGNVIQLVGSKSDTFGQVDAGKVALARGEGAKLKVVAAFFQKSPGALISEKSAGIESPNDIIGKSVGISQGSSSAMMFRAFLGANGIPETKVNLIVLDPQAKVPSLLHAQLQAITGFITDECVQAKEQSKAPIACMSFADYGLRTLGSSLVVHEDTIKENPDLVQRFTRATLKAWEEAINHPEEAAALGHKDFPMVDEGLLLTKFKQVPDLMHSPSTKGRPFGWMAEEDWNDTIAMLEKYAGLKNSEAPSAYYTNQFIP